MKTKPLSEWQTPASSYPDATCGRAKISTIRYRRGIYDCYRQCGYDYYRADAPLPIKRLQIARRTWMVDDPPHWWAMEEHAKCYYGHVLVAGLGLGLIVHTLTANPAVEKITVVEIEKDVIQLVADHLPHDKLQIVHGDFWDWTGEADCVFYDLFVGDGRELVISALRVYLQLMDRFPDVPIRIHGFSNTLLAKFGDSVRESKKEWERTHGLLRQTLPE